MKSFVLNRKLEFREKLSALLAQGDNDDDLKLSSSFRVSVNCVIVTTPLDWANVARTWKSPSTPSLWRRFIMTHYIFHSHTMNSTSTPCQFQWCGNEKLNLLPFYCEQNLTHVPRPLLINTPYPIINTCLSSHLASDQHHLGFDTLSAGLTAPWCTNILSVNISAHLTQPTCQAMRTLQVKLPQNYADHHVFHMHREPYAT